MEIKIICNCGRKFKFDVEPDRGGMPMHLKCQSCGVDVTHQAKAIIHPP